MRTLLLGLTAACATVAAAPLGAVAAVDPPATHYSSGKSPHDPRLAQAKPVGRYRGFLRVAVDLSAKMPPVGDQGSLPSSLAWAMAYAARGFYEASEDARNPADPHNEASPSYVYHLARQEGCADGVTPSKVADVLHDGALSLADYPYSASCAPPAAQSLVARAHEFKIRGLSVLDLRRLDDIKAEIERGNPVIVSFRDGSAFQAFRGDGVFDDPAFDPNVEEEAYQALTIVGYDERRQAVRVMNSWGRGWGDQGFAWISYRALAARMSFALVLDAVPDGPSLAPAAVATAPQTEEPRAPQPFVRQDDLTLRPDAPPASAEVAGSGQAQAPAPMADAAAPKPGFAALDNLACGHIKRRETGGHTLLSGYVATMEDLALTKAVAENEPNTVLGKVDVAPWPLCEALETLERPLAKEGGPRLTLSTQGIATEGDTLRIAVEAPHAPSFLYVSYFQADGTVVTLAQPQAPMPTQSASGQRLIFGDGQAGRPRFTVSPPFGAEMVVVLAAGSPLFAERLPAKESERDYLTRLRAALLYKPAPNLPDRDVTAAVQALTTRPRSTAGSSP